MTSKGTRKKIVIAPKTVSHPGNLRLRTLRPAAITTRNYIFELSQRKTPTEEKSFHLDSSKKKDSGSRVSKYLSNITKAGTSRQNHLVPDDSWEKLQIQDKEGLIINKTLDDGENSAKTTRKRIVIVPNRVHALPFLRRRTLQKKKTIRPFVFVIKKKIESDSKESAKKSPYKKITIVPNRVQSTAFLRLRTLRQNAARQPFMFEMPNRSGKTGKSISLSKQNVTAIDEMQAQSEPEMDPSVHELASTSNREIPRNVQTSPKVSRAANFLDLYKIVDDAEYKFNLLEVETRKKNLELKRAKAEKEKKRKKKSGSNEDITLRLWRGEELDRKSMEPWDLDVILDMIISVVGNVKRNAEDDFEKEVCDEYLGNLQKLITDRLDKRNQLKNVDIKMRKVKRDLMARNKYRIEREKEIFQLRKELEKLRAKEVEVAPK